MDEDETALYSNDLMRSDSNFEKTKDFTYIEAGDTLFLDALEVAVGNGKISTSLLQRRLGIGYSRAAKLIDRMSELGYIGEANGHKERCVYITEGQFLKFKIQSRR